MGDRAAAGLRHGDAAAFSVDDGPVGEGSESVVLLVQCRLTDPAARAQLERDVRTVVQQTAAIEARIVLVRPHALPQTSSGKLSRVHGAVGSSPADLIDMLNRLFSAFDELVDRHRLEKIKTIGDAYMVAGGLPEPRPGHLEAMATFALELSNAMQSISAAQRELEIRIGLHVGSVVAGVIGRRKFSYDVWGDTVNTASRLESHGGPGHPGERGRVPAAARSL